MPPEAVFNTLLDSATVSGVSFCLNLPSANLLACLHCCIGWSAAVRPRLHVEIAEPGSCHAACLLLQGKVPGRARSSLFCDQLRGPDGDN